MSIIITKDQIGTKFYSNKERPSAIIYTGNDVAILNEDILVTPSCAFELSQLVSLLGIFIESLQAGEDEAKNKAFTVLYVNELMTEQKTARYSPRNVIKRMYSGQVVTVDMKKRIRFEFTSFGFENNTIIINYKPVIW